MVSSLLVVTNRKNGFGNKSHVFVCCINIFKFNVELIPPSFKQSVLALLILI